MVDVAPTLVALTGGAPLAVQDGHVRDELVEGPADHVLVFLIDGTNAAALWSAVEEGDAPTIGGLMADGTTYRHGVLASLPTATLANHTTALTGAAPGHSGILSHTWFDRTTGETPNLLEIPAMFSSRRHLVPEVDTVFESVKAGRPGAVAVCTFEFCDRGADWSTYDLLDRRIRTTWPDADAVADQSSPELLADDATAFMSQVDTASTQQALERWSGREHDLPTFCWVNLSSTDTAGHASGPHSWLTRAAIRDSDRRIGRVLDAVEGAGALDRTAVVVLADHGMQQAADDPPTDLGGHLPRDRWLLVDHQLAYAIP
jgi:predicted AlkP superfamily pyrophosphatase or phosphodiesterase